MLASSLSGSNFRRGAIGGVLCRRLGSYASKYRRLGYPATSVIHWNVRNMLTAIHHTLLDLYALVGWKSEACQPWRRIGRDLQADHRIKVRQIGGRIE
jgi:hypothetical protein